MDGLQQGEMLFRDLADMDGGSSGRVVGQFAGGGKDEAFRRGNDGTPDVAALSVQFLEQVRELADQDHFGFPKEREPRAPWKRRARPTQARWP